MLKSKNVCMLYGLIAAFVAAALMTVVLSFICFKLNVTKDKARICVLAIYILSNFAGGFVTGKITGTKKFIKGLITGSLFFIILLVVSLIVNKGAVTSVSGVLLPAVLCSMSGLFGGMIS